MPQQLETDDFLGDLGSLNQKVSQQEKERQPALRELLLSKAQAEPEFRKSLLNNPEKTIGEVAKSIGATATPELVQDVKEHLSRAIFGATDEQVNKLVFDTLDNVRKSFERTLTLSQSLFWVGLLLTAAAFVATLVRSDAKAWIAGVFGAGGIATLVSYAVMNPLDRIRNAAANLVQMQMAYVAFYKQLNMLGGIDLDAPVSDPAESE